MASRRARESGQGTVEAALALPLFIACFFTIVQLMFFVASQCDLDSAIAAAQTDVSSQQIAPGDEAETLRRAIAAKNSVILDPDRISVSDVAIDGSQSTKEQGLAAGEWDELRVSRATESVNRTSIKATVTYRFEGVLPGIGTADVQRRVDGLRTLVVQVRGELDGA